MPLLSEDYLIRQINVFLAAMAQLVGLKTAGQYQAAHTLIDYHLEQLLGLRADLVKNLTDESLLASLTKQGQLDTERLYLVAELFREDAEVLEAQGLEPESRISALRALKYFVEVVLAGGPENFEHPSDRIEALCEKLGISNLPEDTLFALYCYDEREGNYARAVQSLARLQQAPGAEEQIRQELQEFLQRLLDRSDQELEKGGVSRSEVERWLSSF
jgi:ribosome assembly protein YihI (activator of Der GTPase)